MDLVASKLAIVSLLVQIMKAVRSFYDVQRNAEDIPQEILSVLIILEEAQDLTELYAKAGQGITKMEYMDKKFAVLLILLF
jgi:hypothetical protein